MSGEDAPKFREGQQIELGAHRSQIQWLRVWIVLLAVLATLGSVAGGLGFWRAGQAVNENCRRIHRIVSVGSQLIVSGRTSLSQYLRDGTITREQYNRALIDSDKQLARWRSADCPLPPKVP